MHVAASRKPIVAAFDFDGTLSRGTSGMRFYRQLLGEVGYHWMAARFAPLVLAYLARFRDEDVLNRLNRYVFRGRLAADVRREAEIFARDTLPRFLLPTALETLHAHLGRGDRCVIVSRGFAWCLEPWAQSLGIRDVLATELEVGADGRLTGRMCEGSCDGELKRRRLLRLLGERERWEVHAYGDSAGDLEMFRAADHAFVRRGAGFTRWNHDCQRLRLNSRQPA